MTPSPPPPPPSEVFRKFIQNGKHGLPLGTDEPTKTDVFSEKFQKGGGVISNPKIYIADFCHYKRYFGHEFWKKSAI